LDLGRVIRALRFSWQGLRAAWVEEAAFRQEAVLAMFMVPAAFWLGRNGIERSLLVGTVVLVLIVELLNSAIEAIVDLASPGMQLLAGRAKDMGSAAVLFSLALCAFVWVQLMWQRFGPW
jgi:diacylglycerol kinase (ATP)